MKAYKVTTVVILLVVCISATYIWSNYIVQDTNMRYENHKNVVIDHTPINVTENGNNVFCSETYRSKHWISTEGKGRMGNLMFQLATLLATAKLTCRTPAVSSTSIITLRSAFNVSNLVEINFKKETKGWKMFKESCRHSLQLLGLDPSANWTIDGYLNSWKNFYFYADYIKSVFTFNKNIIEAAIKFMSGEAIKNKCQTGKSLFIGIHIRRGDFLDLYDDGFRVATTNYTLLAREHFRNLFPKKTLCYIVVSDDLKWCKENIKGTHVFYSNLTLPAEDMALLSLCNHTIISTGTFGWFGAWLAGGHVVYYTDFPRRDSKECPSNGYDFMPTNWIGLP